MPVDIRKARNGDLHRKFMALVSFVADNHPRLHTRDQVLRELKYRTHHFDEYVTRAGTILYEMRSISWREMDDVEFAEWVGRAREIVFAELFPDLPAQVVDDEIASWLAWT